MLKIYVKQLIKKIGTATVDNAAAKVVSRATSRATSRAISVVLKVSFVLLVLNLQAAQAWNQDQREGMPATRLILPALYTQGVFLKFVIGSYGKSDLEKIQAIKDAELAIQKFAFQKREILLVSNLDELEQHRKDYFPRFYTLEDELEFRRTKNPPAFFSVVTQSNEVGDSLEKIWRNQEERLASLGRVATILNSTGLTSPISKMSIKAMIFSLLNNPRPIQFGLGVMSDKARLELANLMHLEIRKGIEQINSTGKLIAGSGAVTHASASMQRFFQLTIGEYFHGLDIKEKLNIIAEFVDNPDLTRPNQKFEMMVMNSGPQFQKLFQVYAREEGFSAELKEIFKRLESSVKPAPWRLVSPIINSEPVMFKWLEISEVPFGVGTMAQVHKAKIRLANGEVRDVVVRVMKPGIESRLHADNLVLKYLAPIVDADPELIANAFPKISPFINEIIGMGMKELNVPKTVQAQKKAGAIYERELIVSVDGKKRSIRLHVPTIYEVGPESNLMVQEFISGVKFEKFAKENAGLALVAVEELAKIWLESALLGSGFFHADLHQGNLLMSQRGAEGIQVNILDFGMTGQLDPVMQSRMIAFAPILISNRPDLIAKAIWEISNATENKISFLQLQVLIEREMVRQARLSTALPPDLGLWIALAADAGIKFPAELTSLNRGLTLMTQLLRGQNSRLNLADIVKRALVRNPLALHRAMNSMNSISKLDWMSVLWAGLSGENSGEKIQHKYPQEYPGGLPVSVKLNRSCQEIFSSL